MNFTKLFILFIITLFSTYMYSGEKDLLNLDLDRDIQLDLSVRAIEGCVYFKLIMLNETKGGFYSLLKENPDGTVESICVKKMEYIE